MDIADQMANGKPKTKVKQFWAEYSQTAYEHALSLEECVKDYSSEANPDAKLQISAKQREGIIALISELHKKKGYRKETMFIAFGLLDRFLAAAVESGLTVKELDLV